MKSAWQEYKEKLGSSRPWHLLNSQNYGSEELAASRLDVCNSCDKLIKSTKQCSECGCVMPMKVKLQNATCPLSKW